jgi:tetratricopeptide (TPR) repeat protein
MLHRFAADALNESKPELALKFLDRAISLNAADKLHDLNFYQTLIELRVQVLLVLAREDEAVTTLEEARELLPNNPAIARWLERLNRRRGGG